MGYRTQRVDKLLIVIFALTGVSLLGIKSIDPGLILFQSAHALQQSQIVTCSGGMDSCQTVTCLDNEPCNVAQSSGNVLENEQNRNEFALVQPEETTGLTVQSEQDTNTRPTEDLAGTTLAPEDDLEVMDGVVNER